MSSVTTRISCRHVTGADAKTKALPDPNKSTGHATETGISPAGLLGQVKPGFQGCTMTSDMHHSSSVPATVQQ